MTKEYGLEDITAELIASVCYVCKRLERLHERTDSFAPLAKLLIDSAVAERQTDGKELEIEDVYVATQHIANLIDELESLLDSSIH